MADHKEYWSTESDQGSIRISEDVVASIAALAASETDGVSGLYSSVTRDIVSFLSKKNLSLCMIVSKHCSQMVHGGQSLSLISSFLLVSWLKIHLLFTSLNMFYTMKACQLLPTQLVPWQ